MLITKENQAKLLVLLYNNSKPQGMGFLHYDNTDMTEEEAKLALTIYEDGKECYFDYVKGRVMKVDLTIGKKLDLYLYKRDNGDDIDNKLLEIV